MDFERVQTEIEAIPGNGPVLEALCRLLEDGEAIALVGAGASAGLWPLWHEFLDGFIAFGRRHDNITEEEAEFLRQEAASTPLETAQQLRNKLDEPLYFEYLHDTFSDKSSPLTHGAFTPTHQALLQLPVQNYLTLNYDAGLTNARAALYPGATTSYYFWDQEEARRILDRGSKRYVLHAHGRYDRAESIILTQDDYRKAYSPGPFLRLLNELFDYQKLLIVGFGLTDPYIKRLFDSIRADYKQSSLQHIALVGLDDEDHQVTSMQRERVQMNYGARILFYPSQDHHRALTHWLTALAQQYGEAAGGNTAEAVAPLTVSPILKQVVTDIYHHQPSDDENFEGRMSDFATLNRWGNDPATRAIAVIGIGGQGKTALTGRWLKRERAPELAGMPVFYWSFYEDLDVRHFLQQAVAFCLPITGVPIAPEIEPIAFLLRVVEQHRLLLVLDGVEVLQESHDGSAHGRIRDPHLLQLLQQWLRYPHRGLMLLTSRFPFPQLARYSGIGFHHLELMRLTQADDVSLLRRLGLRVSPECFAEYVEKFHGHPLALRVLASSVHRACFGDLAQFEGDQIIGTNPEDPLSQKLERLLGFYESRLQDGQRELLGIISLFKRPVTQQSFLTLLGNMESLQNTSLAQADEMSPAAATANLDR